LANKLPRTYYDANHKVIMTGAQVKARKDDLPDEMLEKLHEFEDAKKYVLIRPQSHVVNHRRRLVQVYSNGGIEAAKKYIDDMIELMETQNNPKEYLRNSVDDLFRQFN